MTRGSDDHSDIVFSATGKILAIIRIVNDHIETRLNNDVARSKTRSSMKTEKTLDLRSSSFPSSEFSKFPYTRS